VNFSTLGSAAEAIVFCYIGLCVFTYWSGGPDGQLQDDDYEWSPKFIMIMSAVVICGRIGGLSLAHLLFSCCTKEKDVNLRELSFIIYGGLIRGAIAFGLVLKIESGKDEDGTPYFRERGIVVTTTLAIVIMTTMFFGTFMPLV